MWLPLQLTLEFLGRSLAWLGVMAALGTAAALLVWAALRRPRRTAWPGPILAGIAGAVAGASLAGRFGLPEALVLRIWRRDIPLAWSAGGALLGVAAAAAWASRRSPRSAAGSPPAG